MKCVHVLDRAARHWEGRFCPNCVFGWYTFHVIVWVVWVFGGCHVLASWVLTAGVYCICVLRVHMLAYACMRIAVAHKSLRVHDSRTGSAARKPAAMVCKRAASVVKGNASAKPGALCVAAVARVCVGGTKHTCKPTGIPCKMKPCHL